MNIIELITEANVATKLRGDLKTKKLLRIAVYHDATFNRRLLSRLGPRPTDDDILDLWSEVLDSTLSATKYGDVSRDGKFDKWLTDIYIRGAADYEDVKGEGGDALGAWNALSTRNKLKPEHQDFNVFKNLRQIQLIVRNSAYRDILRRIQDSAVIEKHKREKKEVTLIDNNRFLVVIPFNYGACYTFNNSLGYNASFCTGSSRGLEWFKEYAPRGPIVSIFDKANADHKDGKWQMHLQTNQLQNGDQDNRSNMPHNDKRFAELFPGLMKSIADAMTAKAEEITAASMEISNKGYDVAAAVTEIQMKAPLSYASVDKTAEPEPDANDGPGVYLVTHNTSGRSMNVTADSLEHARQQILSRYPTINFDQFTFQLQAENDAPQ